MTAYRPSTNVSSTPNLANQLSTPESLRIYEIPPHPEDFSPVGIAYWQHYCGIYLSLNNLSRGWLVAIENICRLQDYTSVMQGVLDSQGVMLIDWIQDKDSSGKATGEATPRSKCNPLFRDYMKATHQIHSMLGDMGLTPYSAKVAQLNMNSPSDLAPKVGGKPAVARPIEQPEA